MCKHCLDYDDPHHKDFIRGGVDPEDFDKEVNYQTNLKKKNKKVKTRPGCPGNDYKAHVYVWTTENEYRDFFCDYFGFPKYQHNICAGCGKRNGTKCSDQYMKVKEREWAKLAVPEKGVPIPFWRHRTRHYVSFKWWDWENYNEDYRKARKAYIDRHGLPRYIYGF